MNKSDPRYDLFSQILREELRPAMGCTEPISLAYCAARARALLCALPDKVEVTVSGNIVKNVKSVVVPNTGGRKGIEAAIAGGIIAGDETQALQVLSHVTDKQKAEIGSFLQTCPISVHTAESGPIFEIDLTLYSGSNHCRLRIINHHTNIVLIEKNGELLFESSAAAMEEGDLTDRSCLSVAAILDYAATVDLKEVVNILERQIEYNMAIAHEGLTNDWGASIGQVLLRTRDSNDLRIKCCAAAAAGSDARMSGCELPVVICSGSGNQGMTASIPVITYAQETHRSKEELLRALIISNLITIHQKTDIGFLSAFCGAVSAGCGAGCAIAWLETKSYEVVAHTLVNTLAIVSGIVCDGAKPSCAAKIVAAVEAGFLGYDMYACGKQFYNGEGIVSNGVENTIRSVGRLGRDGMRETDREILRIMTGK